MCIPPSTPLKTHRCFVWLFVATYILTTILFVFHSIFSFCINSYSVFMDRKPQSKIYIMSNEAHSVRIRCWCCVARFFDLTTNFCISSLLCNVHALWIWPHKPSNYMRASQIKDRSRMWWQNIIAAMLDHCEGAEKRISHSFCDLSRLSHDRIHIWSQ